MSVSEYFKPWADAFSQWGDLLLIILGTAIGIVMASAITRELTKALRTHFEPEKMKGKPKRTGEKLKRDDGEVLDVIQEKRTNDANDPRMP